MEGFQDESAEFSIEQVENIIRDAIKAALHDCTYNPKKVNEWTNQIVASCLKSLQELGKPQPMKFDADLIYLNYRKAI